MADPKDDSLEEKNQSIVNALRTQFSAMVQRLTTDVEPALIYQAPIPAVEGPDEHS